MKLLRRIQTLFRRKRLESEMQEEMRHHLEEQARRNEAAGMSVTEARSAAQRQFGNLASLQERAREVRGTVWFEQLVQDLRYAWRQVRGSPGFAATTIAIMALGLGITSALFSVINGVLLRPLPLPEPDRVVIVSESHPVTGRTRVAPAVYLDWAAQTSSFEELSALIGRSYLSQWTGRGQKLNGHRVTANYFRVLGVEPLLGRTFTTAEEVAGADRVVVLSHRIWQNWFGGRGDILDQVIELDDVPYTIIGVMPDVDLVWNPALFVPLSFTPADRLDYGNRNYNCIGRLKPGVGASEAEAELVAICRRIAEAHPDTSRGRGAAVQSWLADLTSDAGRPLHVLLGAVGAMLLIAVINIAGMLLSRASVREREIALRVALGAGPGRIIRQSLAESLLLAVVGGTTGLLLARCSLDAIAQFASRYIPRTDQIALDGRVLVWSAGLIVVTGLATGLAPALQSSRRGLLDACGRGATGGGRASRWRLGLIALQIALTLMLLTSSALLVQSWKRLQTADQGFDPEGVHLTQFDLGSGRRYDSPEKIANIARAAIGAVAAVPGVEYAALTNGQPMIGFQALLFQVEGAPDLPTTAMPLAHDAAVTPDYFQAMKIRITRGRGFEAGDAIGAPRVVIISEDLARRHFAGRDPIGKRIMLLDMSDRPDAWREIVGVAADVRPRGPQSEVMPQVYEPLAQRPNGVLALVVRYRGPMPSLAKEVSIALANVDPLLPVPEMREYSAWLERAWSRQQFSLVLFSGFSVMALSLAVVGIYGVTAFAVARRTGEFGIRLALGARPRELVALVLRGMLRVAGAGIVLGLAGSVASQRLIQSMLYDTAKFEPRLFTVVIVVILSAVLLAGWLPARRAMKVDPMVALRAE